MLEAKKQKLRSSVWCKRWVTVIVTDVLNAYVPGELHELLIILTTPETGIFIPIKLSDLFKEGIKLSPDHF